MGFELKTAYWECEDAGVWKERFSNYTQLWALMSVIVTATSLVDGPRWIFILAGALQFTGTIIITLSYNKWRKIYTAGGSDFEKRKHY